MNLNNHESWYKYSQLPVMPPIKLLKVLDDNKLLYFPNISVKHVYYISTGRTLCYEHLTDTLIPVTYIILKAAWGAVGG